MRRLSLIGVSIVSAGVLAVALLSPVGAHITNLPHLINHLEDEFLSEGPIVLDQNGPWGILTGSSGQASLLGPVWRIDPTGGPSVVAGMLVTVPAKVGGQRYLLKSVRICYDLFDGSGGDKIDETLVSDVEPPDPTTSTVVSDPTDHAAPAGVGECYTVAPPSPYRLDGPLQIQLKFDYSSATTDLVDVSAIETTWVPA
jgi:hypothetical protein